MTISFRNKLLIETRHSMSPVGATLQHIRAVINLCKKRTQTGIGKYTYVRPRVFITIWVQDRQDVPIVSFSQSDGIGVPTCRQLYKSQEKDIV